MDNMIGDDMIGADTFGFDSPTLATPIKSNLDILKEDEGNRNTPYIPVKGEKTSKSGVTIGVGVDLGQHTAGGLASIGVPSPIIEKVQPWLGKKGLDAFKALHTNTVKLTDEEIDTLSESMYKNARSVVSHEFGDKWRELSDTEQGLAISTYYQYGNKFFKQNSFKQLKSGDKVGLLKNLAAWGDTTPKVAKAINARYARWVDRLR